MVVAILILVDVLVLEIQREMETYSWEIYQDHKLVVLQVVVTYSLVDVRVIQIPQDPEILRLVMMLNFLQRLAMIS